ncbi:MAG: hypothetical protein JWO03_1538 [Bacteroidetes bacterium]|nr:hypothetical protein [Bacteroidota bacterium]
MKKLTVLCILALCLTLTGYAQEIKSARIVFYNTENFFDTIKDPKTDDEEFTPGSKSHWTAERYQTKLDHISKVLSAIVEKDAPLVIGLSEIENKKVSEDLAAQPSLKKYDLGVIEQDSPDPRGIDVALLYNKKLLTVISTEFLTVKLPDLDKGTRDILYMKGTVKGAEINFFVNHWPSRRDGKETSQVRRFAAAKVLRNKVDQILAVNPNANIIIMGDLNDNPIDSSVAVALGASEPVEPFTAGKLYDLMVKPYKDHKYSLKYRDENDVFDQMIVSESLIDRSAQTHVRSMEGSIFKAKFMMYDHPKYGEIPNRTYGGPRYYGGYSDHLPVYIDVLFSRN